MVDPIGAKEFPTTIETKKGMESARSSCVNLKSICHKNDLSFLFTMSYTFSEMDRPDYYSNDFKVNNLRTRAFFPISDADTACLGSFLDVFQAQNITKDFTQYRC